MSPSEKFGLEVAKSLGEAAKEAVTNLIGPPTKELGMLFGDVIADWRARNLVAIYQRFKKKAESLKLPADTLNSLPIGYRSLVFEQGSREDRPSLQDAWAKLLATSASEGYSDVHQSYANDIQSLTPLGAKILMAIKAQGGASKPDDIELQLLETTAEIVSQSDIDIEASLAILLKLGMLSVFPDKLESWDVSGLNQEFGDDVGALANTVRALLLDSLERAPYEPTNKYNRSRLEDRQYIWFEMWLSPYGQNFCSACLEKP